MQDCHGELQIKHIPCYKLVSNHHLVSWYLNFAAKHHPLYLSQNTPSSVGGGVNVLGGGCRADNGAGLDIIKEKKSPLY